MQPDRSPSTSQVRETTFDAGLRTHFQRVYNIMAFGLVITGLTAYIVANTPALLEFFFANGLMRLIVMLSPLAFIFFGFTPGRIQKMSFQGLVATFAAFSGVFGISLATIFIVYSGADITRVFFITAGTFAAMSIFGYTTKRDLYSMGSLLFMGLIGIILATIVNVFMHSDMLHFIISAIGVLVFTGLTAWDTQNIKATYAASYGHEANNKMAVMGALSLYLDFINLFMMLLHLLGNRN